jgi:hypothetical protein
MTPAVFARLVDIELVVGVFDHRDSQTLLTQATDQLLNQSGLARTGITG